MRAEKNAFGFSNTRCFVAGKSEGAPLLGAVGGPQQGHGAPQVRMEMIETHTVCNQHVPELPRHGKVQALLLLPFRAVRPCCFVMSQGADAVPVVKPILLSDNRNVFFRFMKQRRFHIL